MKYRKLGSCDQQVSELGIQIWPFEDNAPRPFDQDTRVRLLEEAFDAGITLFDTADHQGEGLAEELLTKALSHHRHDLVISTKAGYDFYNPTFDTKINGPTQNFEPQFIKYACEQSLRRLKTDYIDLYQLNNPMSGTSEEDELFDCLNSLVKEGKIRFFGASFDHNTDFFAEAELQMVKQSLMSVQMVYNIFEQEPARQVLQIAQKESVAILTSRPHSDGYLTQEFNHILQNFPERLSTSNPDVVSLESVASKLKSLEFLMRHHETTLDRLAIHFNLAQPSIASVLLNASNQHELDEATSAIEEDGICPDCLSQLYQLYDCEFTGEQRLNSQC